MVIWVRGRYIPVGPGDGDERRSELAIEAGPHPYRPASTTNWKALIWRWRRRRIERGARIATPVLMVLALVLVMTGLAVMDWAVHRADSFRIVIPCMGSRFRPSFVMWLMLYDTPLRELPSSCEP